MKDSLNNFINLKDNDLISSFNSKDLAHLIYLLDSYLISYKNKLNFDENDFTFGLEIETEHANAENIMQYIGTFPMWYYQTDNSLVSGIEINSPILKNNESTFASLKEICSFLRDNSKICNNAGAHIHIGTNVFTCVEKFYNFLLLWCKYEKVIYRFSYGEYMAGRKGLNSYAYSFLPNMNKLNKYFDKIFYSSNIYERNYNEKALYEYLSVMDKYCSLNLNNVEKLGISKECNTIEIRCPNGTINEIIWQNNLNFFLNFIYYAINNNIDLDYKQGRCDYNELYLKDAIILSDLIFNNNQDKIDFLKQYIKKIDDFNYKYENIVKLTKIR